jgi:hypothetical protein
VSRKAKCLSLRVEIKHNTKIFLTKIVKLLLKLTTYISLFIPIIRSGCVQISNELLDRKYPETNLDFENISLLPYGTFDCELFYLHLQSKLNTTSLKSKVIHSGEKSLNFGMQIPHMPRGIYTYREKLDIFLELLGNGSNAARGAIDEYRHLASPTELLTKSPFSSEIWNRIMSERNRAIRLSEFSEVFIAPDLGYTFNRTLLQQALSQGKKFFVINPRGFVTDASSVSRQPTSRRNTHEIIQHIEAEQTITQFIEKSFAGSHKVGDSADADNSFMHLNRSESKTLFLHCLRDSDSGILPQRNDSDMPFLDYLEWTEFTLENISRNPVGWRIRLHPHSKRFAGEVPLVNALLQKYSIPKDVIEKSHEPLNKLLHTSAVFTHSGTVALESASLGKLANCCSAFYPSSLSNQLLSREEIGWALNAPPSSVQLNALANPLQKKLAFLCLELMTSYQQQVAQASTPKQKLERHHDDFYRTKAELRLAGSYAFSINTKDAQFEISEIASWIRDSLKTQDYSRRWVLAKNIKDLRS